MRARGDAVHRGGVDRDRRTAAVASMVPARIPGARIGAAMAWWSEFSEPRVGIGGTPSEPADAPPRPPPIVEPHRRRQARGSHVNHAEGTAMTESTTQCAPQLGNEGAWYLRQAATPATGAAALLALFGIAMPAAAVVEGLLVSTRRVHAGGTLFHEGMQADAIHFVAVGTFKAVHVAEDGYEQVLGFCGRGEVLGYDALYTGVHPTAAVALEDSTVLALSPADLSTLCHWIPAMGLALQRELSRQLAHRNAIANLMAAVSAEARLARFLVQLSDRMAERGQSPRRLRLRMSRRDIASHIGVAHETVSRSFSALAHWGCLLVCNREVEILDPQRLRECASSTRGLADAAPVRLRPRHAGAQSAGAARLAA